MLPILRHATIKPVSNLSPWQSLDRVILDRMMDDFCSDEGVSGWNLGNVDMYEDDSRLHVAVELPGFEREQINLLLEDGVLHIQAERQEPSDENPPKYYIRERGLGKWSRSFRLPMKVQEENVQARFAEGVLTIALEKRDENKTHKIEVK